MNESNIIKVLVVDDEKVVRDFLSRFLSLQNLKVQAVESGKKAIEEARVEKFDFVFLDIRMPEMNGLETLLELKKIQPQSKYIMMTGYAVDDLLESAKKEGIFASIKKPFDINQIKTFFETEKEGSKKSALEILIIDDDDSVLSFFKNLLKDKIYSVTSISTGLDALELVRKKNFDLVFLDVVLKDMSGVELFLKIRETKSGLTVVLITGYSEKIKDLEHLGITTCLTKPFDIDKIFVEIDKIKHLKGVI